MLPHVKDQRQADPIPVLEDWDEPQPLTAEDIRRERAMKTRARFARDWFATYDAGDRAAYAERLLTFGRGDA